MHRRSFIAGPALTGLFIAPASVRAQVVEWLDVAVRQRWPGSTVLDQGDSQLGRAQGRAFTLAVDQSRGFLAMRFYYLGQRLYQLAVLGRMEYRQNQSVLHFLNSLRLSS